MSEYLKAFSCGERDNLLEMQYRKAFIYHSFLMLGEQLAACRIFEKKCVNLLRV